MPPNLATIHIPSRLYVYGFLEHSNSLASTELLLQSITTGGASTNDVPPIRGSLPNACKFKKLLILTSHPSHFFLKIWLLPGPWRVLEYTAIATYAVLLRIHRSTGRTSRPSTSPSPTSDRITFFPIVIF
ncbi:hypothetical protein Hypma_006728 [Hypsizygus marmoreus]|uniref:Uncharacterized protein n=1 Tax=Hypsizygus marmoreus TaxID=39966 RepID=A0A369K076_HYPMA|nr:hypothetical protein Hypma_006728 [Hypsizygus marmoreus]